MAKMTRTEFLKNLKLGGGALMAIYCMGAVTSCANENTPLPATNINPDPFKNGKVDFTLDLTLDANKNLKTDGGYLYNGDIIVARSKGAKYIALSKICTHQGTTVEFQKDTNDLYCPNHGSKFDVTGKVINSPAPLPLKMYQTELLNSGLKLRVFEA